MRLRTLALAVSLVLSFLAHGLPADAQPTLSVSATLVPPNSLVTVTITNPPNGSSWIGRYPTGSPDNTYIEWWWVRDLPGTTTRTWTVNMGATLGTYDFRLFADSGYTRVATSPTVRVAIFNPTPGISLPPSPPSVTVGSAAFALTVNGTGFVSGATATVGGQARAVTPVSATQLTVHVQAADVAAPGNVPVQVTNPAPCDAWACASNTVYLSVVWPTPTISSLNPTSVPRFSSSALTINGTGFVSGATVTLGGQTQPVGSLSPTQITLWAVSGAPAANVPVQVTNPAPCAGGTCASNTANLTVIGEAISVSATTSLPLGSITATLTNNLGAYPNLLVLAASGSAPTTYLQGVSVDALPGITSKTWTVTMPGTPGQYEFRLLVGYGGVLTATSPVVTVAISPTVATVELGPAGNEAPAIVFCDARRHKVIAGSQLDVQFRGRATAGSDDTGRIHLSSAAAQNFSWPPPSGGDPDPSPSVTFPAAAMSVLTGPRLQPVRISPTAPPRLYSIEFIAIDSRGVASSRRASCQVEVVNQLPDVEVADLRYDPPQAGVAGRTVRMKIRNNMPSGAPALARVPWSIVFSTATGLSSTFTGGRPTVRETMLASGVQTNVAPGSTFEVTARFTRPQTVGTRDRVVGWADRGNSLGENAAERPNNSKALEIYPSEPAPPPQHTCEAGTVEVNTAEGGKGCATEAPPEPCTCKWWQCFLGWGTCCCPLAFICESGADCASGRICARNSAGTGYCVLGHAP